MRYALLIYTNTEVRDQMTEAVRQRITAEVAEVLARPNVTGMRPVREEPLVGA